MSQTLHYLQTGHTRLSGGDLEINEGARSPFVFSSLAAIWLPFGASFQIKLLSR